MPSTDFAVRDGTIDDVASLTTIHSEAWRASGFGRMTPEQVERAVAVRCTEDRWRQFVGDSTVLLGSANGTPAGLLQLVRREDGSGEIVRMYVHPNYWRSGLAQSLMHEALMRFESMGVERVVAFSADTVQARRFYEKCGFTPTGNSHEAPLLDDLSVTDYEYVIELLAESKLADVSRNSTEAVRFDCDDLSLSGVLHRSTSSSDVVAILLHGGPGGSKQGPSGLFVKLADVLAETGVSAFRFDFAGEGESDGDYRSTSTTHQVRQFQAAADWLRGRGYKRFAVVGESLGGTCALGGYQSGFVEVLVLLWPAIWLRETALGDFMTDDMVSLARIDGSVDIDDKAVGVSFLEDLLAHQDRERQLREVVAPTLLIHGTADSEVPVWQSERAHILLSGSKRLVIQPDAEHCFRRANEQALVVDEVVGWTLLQIIGDR